MVTMIGIFREKNQAEKAISELNTLGFEPKDMSVVVKSDIVQSGATNKGEVVADNTVAGATTGGILGGLAGLLIGVGAIAIPGIGGLLIGGPLAAALGLTGAAATTVAGATTGVLAGGVVGALVGLGLPPDEAKVYEERIRGGAIVLAVGIKEEEDEDKVRKIYEDYEADQIRSIRAK